MVFAATLIATPGVHANEPIARHDPTALLSLVNKTRQKASWDLTVKLRHVEHGEETNRTLNVQWATWGDEQASLMTVLAPDTLAGTTLLTHNNFDASGGGKTWVVFPIAKPVALAIPDDALGQRVLGSLFTHRDLQRRIAPNELDLVIVAAKSSNEIVIQGTPKPSAPTETQITRVRWHVDVSKSDISKTEYFDDRETTLKTVAVLGWHEDGGDRIPSRILVTDVRSGATSEMLLQEAKKIPGFSKELFEVDAVCLRVGRQRGTP